MRSVASKCFHLSKLVQICCQLRSDSRSQKIVKNSHRQHSFQFQRKHITDRHRYMTSVFIGQNSNYRADYISCIPSLCMCSSHALKLRMFISSSISVLCANAGKNMSSNTHKHFVCHSPQTWTHKSRHPHTQQFEQYVLNEY